MSCTHHILCLACFLLHTSPAATAPPPELALLRAQYDKTVAERVTAPFEASLKELNTKYIGGLDRAIAEAKEAGRLEDILTLEAEKKRLADKLPVPATDEETEPAALTKLRPIYREQLKKIEDNRASSHQAFLPGYTAKLQALEAMLVKADRVNEAKEVLEYRKMLGTDHAVAATASDSATMPVTPAKPSDVLKGKGDERKAAEWILENWSESKLWVDEKIVSKTEELPKGRFSINHIAIDSRFYKNGRPAPADFQVLAGLPKLRYLQLSGFSELKDEDLSFITTLPSLTELLISKTLLSDAFVSHLGGVRSLSRLEISECTAFIGTTLGQLATLPLLSSVRFWKCPITDDAVAGLATLPKLEMLNLDACPVTDACLPVLRSMRQVRNLCINATKITPEGLAARPMPHIERLGANKLSDRPMKEAAPLISSAFPNLTVFQFAYEFETADDLAALAHFKKLKAINCYGTIHSAAWPGLTELRELASFSYETSSPPLPDEALLFLADLKKLKRLTLKKGPPSAVALAAFKKKRPDVKVEP